MNVWLRRLLEPAKTSPPDIFRWSDRRLKSKQMVSGARIAAGWIVGFVVILSVFVTLGRLSDAQSVPAILVFCAVLLAAAGIMLCTAERWAPWVPSFFFGPPIRKLIGALLLGGARPHMLTPSAMLQLLAAAVAVVAFTWRFIGKRPAMTTFFDRVALTVFAFAALYQVTTPYQFPPWWFLLGLIALFTAWCAHRWRVARA